MASTNIINSTLVGMYIDGTLIAHLTDAGISMTHSPREVTSKDSGGYQEFLEGIRGATMSATAWLNKAAGQNDEDIFTLINGRTTATVRWASSVAGDKYYEVSAYVTSFDPSSPGQEDNVSYAVAFQGTGTITTGDVV